MKECNAMGSEKCFNIVWDGKPIKESCPEACGLCEEKNGDATTAPSTMPPTKPPTASPTTSPVGNDDNNDTCVDDPTFRYKGVKECKWIAKDTEKRCNKEWEGTFVKESCRATCNLC